VKKYQLINIDKPVEVLTEFISVLTSWLYWLINFQQMFIQYFEPSISRTQTL